MSLLSLLGGVSGSPITTIPAQGVDLDGALDYFSRSTDLTGNVDSKTFTFSAWVYLSQVGVQKELYTSGSVSAQFFVQQQNDGTIRIGGFNTSGTLILDATITTKIPLNTFTNLQVSIDMNNTANRKVYLGDLAASVTWTTYTNNLIDFTATKHDIAAFSVGDTERFKGRLLNVFLDYTYRDLSIEANRRLFIDANGKPADGWKSLSPIIGMSMTDAATAHINDYGTGGNFTPNGTFATSNRGANQDNCVASYFDGVADYLSRTSLTGIADGKQFTLSFSFDTFSIVNGKYIMSFYNTTSTSYQLYSYFDGTNFKIGIGTSTGSNSVTVYSMPIYSNRNYHITLSYNGATVNSTRVAVNGIVSQIANSVITWNIGFITQGYNIAKNGTTTYYQGNLGELYFNTTYIDLATSNPFWDSVENKPIPVRKVISNTGVTPLIAMPLDASNAGKNYGTGGDFTANSAPYVGARGASEHWERTSLYNGTTGYLTSTGLTGIADTKTITLVGHIYKNASTLYHIVGSTNSNVSISINASDQLVITAKNTAGTTILSATVTTAIANTTWTSLLLSIDLSNTSNRSVYLNGVSASVTWTTYTNDTIDFTNASWVVGADVAFGNKFAGTMSLMMDNTYIDFSSELNRLKYIDGLGYPLDINAQVSKGVLTQPVLYLASRDTTNLGLNSGYGGNLTVNGTVTAGADVLG